MNMRDDSGPARGWTWIDWAFAIVLGSAAVGIIGRSLGAW